MTSPGNAFTHPATTSNLYTLDAAAPQRNRPPERVGVPMTNADPNPSALVRRHLPQPLRGLTSAAAGARRGACGHLR